ncbi:HAD family hydrolase [Isoptericola dokdonensis]|uniref:Haloacid dehalogenase n=1 Tax=Isoptericola dokdonensis DS-3 TaxID=1300344 RepID=A0A161IJ57_9MICO|nr:HAD family phosphatase [Isoptericola dokdonensis]ANC30180.1 haloacid dehalogenase [Isoptericola dokdonensis DS-3]
MPATAAVPVPAVDTVVLDLGNVLLRWDPDAAFTGVDPDELAAWKTEVDFPAFNHAQDAGRTWADAVAHLEATAPHLAPLAARYVRDYAATLAGGPVPGSADLVAELRAAGVPVYGLTNWAADTYHHAETAAPAVGLLCDVLVSGREGLAKPDPAIFRRAATRFDLDPARTVFVDDVAANVAGARTAGYHGVVFTGTPALRTALADLGLPVARP